ncbi:MAG: hypothetical protein ABSF28_07745 [Terracidiphilus sp.]
MKLASIEHTIQTLYRRGDVVEIRAIRLDGGKPITSIGRYPYGSQIVGILESFDQDPVGFNLYICLNPVTLPPRVLCGSHFAADRSQIARRRWMLLDGDPRRDFIRDESGQPVVYPKIDKDGQPLLNPDGASQVEYRRHKVATEEECHAAFVVMSRVRDYLLERGFPQVILACSGNGWHVLVLVDLANDAPSKRLIEGVQATVRGLFSTAEVDVQTFSDANRITRCYGSLNRKGREAPNRSYRRSGVLEEE